MEQRPLVGIKKIAAYLGLGPKATRKELHAGRIPGREVAGRWISNSTVLNDWLKNRGTEACP